MNGRINIDEKVAQWRPAPDDEYGADKKKLLNFLLFNCRGLSRSQPIPTLISTIWPNKKYSKELFQHKIVVPLRQDKDLFVGTGGRGIYLVETAEDAAATINFYTTRIRSEQKHLRNLRRIAARHKLVTRGPIKKGKEITSIYFDESGTPSLQDSKTQPFFIVTAILVQGKRPLNPIQRCFIGLRAELNKSPDFEFKSNSLDEKEYTTALRRLSLEDFEFSTICFIKERLEGKGFAFPKVFYKYAFRLLTGNVMDYADQADLFFDKYGGGEGSSFQTEFFAYIREKNLDCGQDDIGQLQMLDSRGSEMIQLADLVCGAVRRAAKGDRNLLDLLQDKMMSVDYFPDL